MIEDATLRSARRPVVALVTAPPSAADALAGTLVGEGLAACVSVVPGLRSVYRWRGEVSREDQVLLIVKTTADLGAAIAARLSDLHPDEIFELVILEVGGGNEPYLAWIAASVREP